MRVLAIVSVLALSGCFSASQGAGDLFLQIMGIHPLDLHGPTCDEQCTDREYADHYSARELARLAIWRADRGNCTCGYALLAACGMKDLAVRDAALHDHALRACVVDVSPAERQELRVASTQPGTIAGCIGDE